MRTGIIYKVISPSNNIYIGQTIQKLSQRKSKHHYSAFNKNDRAYTCAISRAIRKYGNNLKWTILHTNVSISNLYKLEIKEIKKHNSFNSGYNLTEGGEGSIGRQISDKTRKQMSESHKGKSHSIKTRKKMSKSNPNAKLNLKIAREIREKYATKKYSHRKLAKKYNVGKTVISRVINNISWIE